MLDKIVGTIVIIVSLISLSICLFITANANLDLKEFTTSLGSLSLNILFGLLLLKSFYYMLPKENILKPYAKYIVVYQREIGMLVFLFVLPHIIYQLLNLNLFHESKIF